VRGDSRWSPEIFQGIKSTVNGGMTIGF